jgi:hypothetical protein
VEEPAAETVTNEAKPHGLVHCGSVWRYRSFDRQIRPMPR